MIVDHIHKKIIFLFFVVLFFTFSNLALAQIATETVSINAQVIDPNANLTPSTSGGSSSGSRPRVNDIVVIPATAVRFSGIIPRQGSVTVFRGLQEMTLTHADVNGNFDITFEEVYEGDILYSLLIKDSNGKTLTTLNFPITVLRGYLTHLSGIYFVPQIVNPDEILNTFPFVKGDCNYDNRVYMEDFLVSLFWYYKPNPPVCLDLYKDGIIDLKDFSLLAYYWTG
ncbi:MAG: hypothetical protein KBD52_01795 [Candidatus Pacebacteria bacterium]|nr:hypothetical protein [Candidatus Paceibacterota bacterium]